MTPDEGILLTHHVFSLHSFLPIVYTSLGPPVHYATTTFSPFGRRGQQSRSESRVADSLSLELCVPGDESWQLRR